MEIHDGPCRDTASSGLERKFTPNDEQGRERKRTELEIEILIM
jgi:hypothetical protein